ncbi:LacI family DNA-binding transcriptional regulator [Cerasicoccus fimbriatus]|uniref:LacI family DNA-binding transcriptional regulator n=1 Tax=Cerasicoccus fimbriatus TaxID=3014554 RepID=UPI0022B40AA5|nr:LacI family DNA-binding transcriptional regulator [Cerasicoccus sp. TK19100]
MAKPNDQAKAPTLKSIAHALGMSVSGVSIALRNDPSIPQHTRDRVQREAARQGYRRNPLVSAFCANRRPRETNKLTTLAYLRYGATKFAKDPHSTNKQFFEGAVAGAEALGYQVDVFDPVNQGIDMQRLDDILYARGIRGLLIGSPFPPSDCMNLRWERYAVVSLGQGMVGPEIHNVSSDNFETLVRVFHSLERMGYSRPGMILDDAFDARVNHHWSAACHSLREQRGDAFPSVLYQRVKELDYEAIVDWANRKQVDVIMGNRHDLIPGLRQRGLKIPEEIGFVAMQGVHLDSRIASVQRNARKIGEIAAELLVDELHRNQRGIPELAKRVRVLGGLAPAASLPER